MQLGISKSFKYFFKERAFIMKKQTKVLLTATALTLDVSFAATETIFTQKMKTSQWVCYEDE